MDVYVDVDKVKPDSHRHVVYLVGVMKKYVDRQECTCCKVDTAEYYMGIFIF